jgi:hypothetical protein
MTDLERALRDSWTTYRKVLGGPLTVGWDDLPEHQRERWRLIVADARKSGKAAPADVSAGA